MAWTAATTNLQLAGTDSLSSCAGDGIPTTGTSYVNEIDTVHHLWVIFNYQVDMPSVAGDAVWEEKDQLILQVKNSAINQAVDFNEDNNNKVDWGEKDLTDAQKPIVYGGCYYLYDQNGNMGGYAWAESSGTFEGGSVDIFGGMIVCWPVQSGSGAGTLWYMPEGTVRIIGTNFCLYGGIRFQHTAGRLQELKFGGSRRKGTSMPEVVDDISVKDVIFMDNTNHLSYSSYAASDERFLNIAFRGWFDAARGEIYFDTTWNNDGLLDNSDDVTTWAGDIGAGASMTERVSYDITAIDEAGTPISGVNVRVTRTLASNYGEEPPTYEADFLEVAIGETDLDGERPSLWLTRRIYEANGTERRIHYAGFYTTMRKYGYSYEYIAKYPVYGAGDSLVDVIIMKTNIFTEGTLEDVSAYTGISMNTGTSTITVSEDHTLQEVYDWLQWECAKQEHMDFESGGNGVEVSHLTTADGTVFVVESGWTLSGTNYITLDGKILELANGNRWVTVSLTGMEELSSYVIEQTDGTDLYSGTADTTGALSEQRLWTTNIAVNILVRLQGYRPFTTSATITSNGLSVTVNQAKDTNYKYSLGRLKQLHFRWRNDDGDEADATWKAAEDTHISGVVKGNNMRIRMQLDEYKEKPNTVVPKLQYKTTTDTLWRDVE